MLELNVNTLVSAVMTQWCIHWRHGDAGEFSEGLMNLVKVVETPIMSALERRWGHNGECSGDTTELSGVIGEFNGETVGTLVSVMGTVVVQ